MFILICGTQSQKNLFRLFIHFIVNFAYQAMPKVLRRLSYFMKRSQMASISMENMTVSSRVFNSFLLYFLYGSREFFCRLRSSLLTFQLWISDLIARQASCPRMFLVSRTSGVCQQRPNRKRLWISSGNMCTGIEKWMKVCFPLWRCFFLWELACFTQWLTTQSCNKLGC